METMRISEKKKKSSKGAIIAFFLFVIIGGGIIFLAVKEEKAPAIVGNSETDTDRLVNLEKNQNINDEDSQVTYEIKENKITDSSNKKIKGDITIPVITINSEEFTELNEEINTKYTKVFEESKNQLSSADNKYTFKVTYKVYENEIEGNKIVSITVYQRTVDDAKGKNVTEKLDTYNIDLKNKKLLEENVVATDMFGKDYKTKLRSAVKDYVVSQNMIKESDYTYAITGLENFYIKEGKFHIYFNSGEVVDAKHGMLDIVVE